MKRLMNFGPGPGALPLAALEQAQTDLISLDGTGIGVLEHSHRGAAFEKVFAETDALLRRIAGIGDQHEILYLQGGASMQFAQIPLAFLRAKETAGYVTTGVWSEKACAEARIVAKLKGAEVKELVSTKETIVDGAGANKETYLRVPDAFPRFEGGAYTLFTSNETVHGVQFLELPKPNGSPLICDMSSDFLSRKVDFNDFDLVFAGAQKNAGPSGLALVIVKKSFLARQDAGVPKIWSYQVAAEQQSMYNTPATFSIYMTRNVLRWLEAKGGIEAIQRENERKAALLYSVIDGRKDVYRGRVAVSSRSRMNVVFELETPEIEKDFLKKAGAADLFGLRGHRMIGGIRASIYNAVELSWVERLAEFMSAYKPASLAS